MNTNGKNPYKPTGSSNVKTIPALSSLVGLNVLRNYSHALQWMRRTDPKLIPIKARKEYE